MTSHSRGGREGADMNWESIKKYLEGAGDKSAEFASMYLRDSGYECDSHGFRKMVVNGVIRSVRKEKGDGGESKNIYVISERLMGMRLEDILKLSYADARRKHNK